MDIGSVMNNRFTVTAPIGKGAMGAVFSAKDAQTGNDVALKVLAASFTFDADMIERFRREGEALKQLRHPNIVSFVDMFEWQGQQVIVMEYVPGGSLFQLIRHGPLPVDQARHIALDLCDALIRAHRLNIIHRDIKPENILLARDGTPRLTDLGVARLIGEGTRLTGTGTQVGTPYYMAPEAWQGQHLDGQADIWSLGVVLYEMLAGQVPFGGETMVAVMNKVLTTPLPDIKAARPDVPPELAKIIRKMLTRDKAKRYQTMREVALDLERLTVTTAPAAVSQTTSTGAQIRTQVAPKPEPPPIQPPRRALPTWIWLAVGGAAVGIVALIALVGGLGWMVYTNGQQSARQATQVAVNNASSPTLAPTKAPESTKALPPTAVSAKPTTGPTQAPAPTQPPAAKALKVGLVLDAGGATDRSFGQGTWEGAQKAAKDFGFEVRFLESPQPGNYESNINQFVGQGYDVIVTVGFMMGDVTAAKAKQYPSIKFAIIDNAYFPTAGSAACPATIKDCYFDGDLTNVTSLMFQEDEAGFLAGVVAAGMSKTGTICTVSGIDIPPVVRYVTGYQAGAQWMKPGIKALNVYLPTFIEPALGHENGLKMISQGCDVVFGVGGPTGNGGLLAAKEQGLMAIGVDADQYLTYPEVKDALLTSAMKNTGGATYNYLKAVKDGTAKAGITTANVQNEGVGLAPYHDWDSKIPDAVKTKVQEALAGLKSGKLTTGLASTPASAPAAGNTVLTVWNGYVAGGSEEKALTQIVAAYHQANPTVTVNVVPIPYADLFKKWETEVAAGGGPDMFTAPNDNLGDEVANGLVLDLSEKLKGKTDGVMPVALQGLTVNGKLYGVPGNVKAVALYYNKSAIPTPPATTDDLMALVKSGKKLVLNENAYHNFGFFGSFGGVPWDETGKCVTTWKGIAALQYLADLKKAGARFEMDGNVADTLFRQGEADMIINGPWVLDNYWNSLSRNLGVAPMPAGPNRTYPAGPMVGIDGWFVNPHSKNVDAALALALYITNQDGQTIYANVAGDPPIRTDVTISDPLVKAFSDAAATGYVRPQATWFGNYWGPFGDAFNNVIEGKATAANAIRDACAAMNQANGK